jgi:hypothetical protein
MALQATLLGLWLVPAVISFHFLFWRFLLIWATFTVMSGYMLFLCSAKRLDRTTPRKVRRLASLMTDLACKRSHSLGQPDADARFQSSPEDDVRVA